MVGVEAEAGQPRKESMGYGQQEDKRGRARNKIVWRSFVEQAQPKAQRQEIGSYGESTWRFELQ